MHKFLVVVERANGNFSAYSPDLPGCVATGATRKEAESEMYEAIEFHLNGLREDGEPIPEASSSAGYVVLGSGPVSKKGVPESKPEWKKRKEVTTRIRRRVLKRNRKTRAKRLSKP